MRLLTEKDIINVMKGASFLGSGGGGSMKDGLIMLDAFKKNHPERQVEIKLADPNEMGADYAVGIAVMGAPSGGTNLDITPCVVNAYDEISQLVKQKQGKTGYTLALELGGVNTFVPMLVSLINDLPMVDADCAGRAVPGLDTVLAAILGCPTAPIAMADMLNNRVQIKPAYPCDVQKIEELALPVVSSFEQNAGIAGWISNQNQVKSMMIQNSITLSLRIGEIITSADNAGFIFNELNRKQLVRARALTPPSAIEYFTVRQFGGWDIGDFYIGKKERYHVVFSNESLLLYQTAGDDEELIMTAPDIITLVDAATGETISNDDLQTYHQRGVLHEVQAVLGIVQVNQQWHLFKNKVQPYWQKYFEACGYHGNIVTYE